MNPTSTRTHITFSSDGLTLSGFFVSPQAIHKCPAVLFIHGSGKHSGKPFCEAILPWQEFLSERGIASLSYYSRGIHDSEGQFADASLANRLLDAQNALSYLKDQLLVDHQQLFVYGHSMGGHVAVQLASLHPTEFAGVVLECAAAYGKEAENVPMGEQFTQIIRTPQSWSNSPVFSILEESTVPVLCMYGEHDEVIPEAVKERIHQAIINHGDFVTIPNGEHNTIQADTPDRQQACQLMYTASAKFIAQVVDQSS